MKIYYDDNPKGQSIAVTGGPASLRDLGRFLCAGKDFVLKTDETPSRFYPLVLGGLSFKFLPIPEALIQITVQERALNLSGGTRIADKLGQSLLSFFNENVTVGEHFHLDYFEGNEILAPTSYHLIFQADTN